MPISAYVTSNSNPSSLIAFANARETFPGILCILNKNVHFSCSNCFTFAAKSLMVIDSKLVSNLPSFSLSLTIPNPCGNFEPAPNAYHAVLYLGDTVLFVQNDNPYPYLNSLNRLLYLLSTPLIKPDGSSLVLLSNN